MSLVLEYLIVKGYFCQWRCNKININAFWNFSNAKNALLIRVTLRRVDPMQLIEKPCGYGIKSIRYG